MNSKPPLNYRDAENLVANQLALAGWQILARNYRFCGFELDIVAEKGKTLAVIEVKSRRTEPSKPIDLTNLISRRKRRALLRGAQHFLSSQTKFWNTVRFDLAVVEKKGPELTPPVLKYYVAFLSPFDDISGFWSC